MKGRIVVLSDNRAIDPRLGTEHGLSLYMETPSGKYLFDTGASGLFMRNAEVLGINLADVDYCLISHGHSDHIGGLSAFLETNHKARVILSAHIPGAEYLSVRRHPHSITGDVDFGEHRDRFVFVEGNTTVGNIHVYANISRKHPLPLGDKNLLIRSSSGELVPDTFRHELAFVVDGVLFTGCAHNGIANILEAVEVPIYMGIGGFHLLDSHLGQQYETDEQLRQIASCLAQRHPNVRFYTGHCTGDSCYAMLADTNNNIHQFHGGQIITI